MLRYITTTLVALILGCTSLSIQATSVLPVDLTQLQRDSQRIIYAECIDNRVDIDTTMNNTVVTYTTFAVLQTVKGPKEQTVIIKQIGGSMPDGSAVLKIAGVPKFKLNEKYVVFLAKPSKLGFSSPIGLSQGSFRAFKDNQGKMTVTNGRDFGELMANMHKDKMPAEGQSIIDNAMSKKTDNGTQHTTMPLNDFMLVIKNM